MYTDSLLGAPRNIVDHFAIIRLYFYESKACRALIVVEHLDVLKVMYKELPRSLEWHRYQDEMDTTLQHRRGLVVF